jgi:hypothetical protein
VLPVPSDDAPFAPPTASAPDPTGDALDSAVFADRAVEDEGVAPGEELAPLPPDPPLSPGSES